MACGCEGYPASWIVDHGDENTKKSCCHQYLAKIMWTQILNQYALVEYLISKQLELIWSWFTCFDHLVYLNTI